MRPSLHNVAPIDQRFEKRFTGGEVISIRGLCQGVSPSKTVRIRLPEPQHKIFLVAGGEQKQLDTVFDTVWLHTDSRILHTVCRVSIPWRRTDTSKSWIVLQENMNARDTKLPPMESRL